jgi:MFS family permease
MPYYIDWLRIFSRPAAGDVAPLADGVEKTIPEHQASKFSRWLPVVSRTVWALGFTSLLTDISSEMVVSILPVYLVLYLGISPLAFGLVDGLYRGVAALIRIAGGVLADRWQQHKTIAILGYGLSAACRLLIFMAGNAWGMITVIITLDRIGKGIRTAPRDALISNRSPKDRLATAFGVHRSLDAVGALLGPMFAFVLLAMMPGAFNVLFVASFGIAILGLGVITLFVPSGEPDEKLISSAPIPHKTVMHLRCRSCAQGSGCATERISFQTAVKLLGESGFRAVVLTAVVLGLASISDGFIFLILQRRLDVGMTAFPLLYVGASLVTAMLAVPCGRLADRVGRRGVLLGGYGLLALVYVVLLLPGGGLWQISAVLVLLGAYYAATDGVLTAMAAAVLPQSHAGSGLAVIATASDLARLAASVLFGLVWSLAGIAAATTVFLLALAAAIVVAASFLIRPKAYDTW